MFSFEHVIIPTYRVEIMFLLYVEKVAFPEENVGDTEGSIQGQLRLA